MESPKTLFDFAPRELSGSAFWAWVLHETCFNYASDKGVSDVGERFLKELGVCKNQVRKIYTEKQILKRQRADIVIEGSEEKILAIIENKVFSTPYPPDIIRQINQYSDCIIKDGKGMPAKMAMSLRYDTQKQWPQKMGDDYVPLLSLKDQLGLFEDIPSNDIAKAYHDYLIKLEDEQKRHLGAIYNDKKLYDLRDISFSDITVFKLMYSLIDGIKKDKEYINIGNSYGRPWAQYDFCKEEQCRWRFFYRLDRDRNGVYLRVNYYAPQPEDRPDIVDYIGDKVLEKGAGPFIWKPRYLKSKEATLMSVYFSELRDKTVKEVNTALKDWHPHFLSIIEHALKH
ncbi:MAG: hypothetical protein CMH32_03270 [Micavibrio sp.]|nr:hypothetical protein [Micavibrio sp.]HCK32118.1 hypothetical protein [Rhodospirillaceae bacterium]|tara:strand:- start:2053 stop:3078 length:1026 start_codon:yes stop_codon:yes gene_type:complete